MLADVQFNLNPRNVRALTKATDSNAPAPELPDSDTGLDPTGEIKYLFDKQQTCFEHVMNTH